MQSTVAAESKFDEKLLELSSRIDAFEGYAHAHGLRIAEIADRATLYREPRHPYTRSLLSAVPVADPDRRRATARVGPTATGGHRPRAPWVSCIPPTRSIRRARAEPR